MSEALLENYYWALFSVLAMLMLYVLQLVVGDIAQASKKHTPGQVYQGDHDEFTFRAVRTPLNSLENMPFMILLLAFGMSVSASALWINGIGLLFAVVRFTHMTAFWLNIGLIRQISWVLGVLGMIAVCVVNALALVS